MKAPHARHEALCKAEAKLTQVGEQAFDNLFQKGRIAHGIAGLLHVGLLKIEVTIKSIVTAEPLPDSTVVANIPEQTAAPKEERMAIQKIA